VNAGRPVLFIDFLIFVLSPVSFLQDVSAVAMDPAMGNPMLPGMRGTVIAAGNPNVATTVPAVIARNPFISRARTRTGVFHHRNRRGDVHNNLRNGGSRQQAQSEQSCKNEFFHEYILPYLWR
jgi:hypothetical protein